MISDFQYDNAYEYSDDLARVKKDGKYGFIDTKGETIIDFQYDGGASFHNNLAYVVKGD